MSDKIDRPIVRIKECLKIAVDTLIDIANSDTNQASKIRARQTITEIKRILDK